MECKLFVRSGPENVSKSEFRLMRSGSSSTLLLHTQCEDLCLGTSRLISEPMRTATEQWSVHRKDQNEWFSTSRTSPVCWSFAEWCFPTAKWTDTMPFPWSPDASWTLGMLAPTWLSQTVSLCAMSSKPWLCSSCSVVKISSSWSMQLFVTLWFKKSKTAERSVENLRESLEDGTKRSEYENEWRFKRRNNFLKWRSDKSRF